MVSTSSIDKAFDAIEEIKVGISKCDVKHTMRNIKKSMLYNDKAYYEAGEDPEHTIAVREKITELIEKFDNDCICHRV